MGKTKRMHKEIEKYYIKEYRYRSKNEHLYKRNKYVKSENWTRH